MSIKSFLFGKKDKMKQQSVLSGSQNEALNQLLMQLQQMSAPGGGYSQSMNYLQQYLDPNSEIYKDFEKPYMQQFENETLPGIAERFAGMGGGMGGGLSSSGFGQSLGAAGANLQANLAQMKRQLQMQAAQGITGQYNQMAGQGLGVRPFENIYQPGSTGFIGQMASGLGAGAGMGGGLGLAGYASKVLGY